METRFSQGHRVRIKTPATPDDSMGLRGLDGTVGKVSRMGPVVFPSHMLADSLTAVRQLVLVAAGHREYLMPADLLELV